MSVSVQEAAERLDLDPGRARRLVSQGLLGGRKVGGRWLVDEVAISDRLASRARPGRPLSPRSSWGLLWSADDRPTPWLAPRERSRARHRARTWPLEDWSWACRRRAAVHRLRAHPSRLQPLLDDARAVRSGASVRHLQVDLIAAGDVELYAREDDLPSLIAEYSLIPSQLPNVIMRVPPAELWLFDDVEAPWPVVAVDLLDARDDRSVRAANDLARRAGSPMIPIVPIDRWCFPDSARTTSGSGRPCAIWPTRTTAIGWSSAARWWCCTHFRPGGNPVE